MPIARFQMPDGRIARFEVPEGTTPEQAQAMMEQAMAGMQPQAAPALRKGIGAAVSRGAEELLSSGQTTLEALTGDPDEVAAAALRRSRETSGKYAEQTGLDLLKKVYKEKGLIGGAKEIVRQVPLAIAEQAPNLAATLSGARLGAMAGSAVAPGVGTVIGGIGGALVPSAVQAFGSNVERRAAEGLPADFKTSAATAVPQAGLDVAGTLIPFGGKLVTKLTGIPMGALFGKTAAQAEKIANERLLATLAKGTATGMAAEIPTEIAQQMLERAQAGLSLASPDALEEYGRTAYQVGLLGPLGAVGRVSEKMGAQEDILQRQKDAQAATVAALASAPAPEVAPEPAPAEVAPVPAEAALAAEPLPTALAPLTPKTAPAAPVELAPAVEPVYTPPAGDLPSLMDQHRTMALKLDPFETQLQAAATKGDTAAINALLPQYNELKTQVQQLGTHIEKLGGTTVDAATFETTSAATVTDIDKKIAAAQKKLAEAGALGDFEAMPKLGTKLDTFKAERDKLTADIESRRSVLAEQQKGLTQRGETRPLFTEAEAPEPTREQQQKYAESRGEVFAEKPEQAATTEVTIAPEKETAPTGMYDLFGDFNLLNTAINDRNPQVLANMHRARQRADQKALEARQPKRTPREQVAELLGPQIGKIIRRERNYDVREIETGDRKGQEVFVSDDIAAAIMALRNTVEKPVGNAKRSLLQQLHDEFDLLEKRDNALQEAIAAGASEAKLTTLRNQVATAQTRYEKKLARIAPYRAKLNAQLAKLYKETEIQTPRQKEAELQALGTSARVLSREAKRAKKSTKAELGLKAQAELDAVLDDVVREVGYKTEEYQKLVGPAQKKLNDKVEQLKKFVDTSVAKLEALKAEKGEDSKKYNTAVTNFIKQKKDRTQVVDAFAKSVAADLEAKARAIGAASPALAEAQEKAKKEFAKREKPVTAAQEPVYQRGTQATRNINKLSEIRTESPESRAETARGQERFESGLSEQKGSAYDYAQRQEALDRTRKAREAKAAKGTAMQVAMTKAAQEKVLKEVANQDVEEKRFAIGSETESKDLSNEQVKLLEDNKLQDAYKSISEDDTNQPLNRAVSLALEVFADNTTVKLHDKLYAPDGQEVLGMATSRVVDLSRNGGLTQEVLLHEGTHAAVERVIQMAQDDITLLSKEQQAAYRELEALYNSAKKDPSITSANAKSNISEFAAEVLSNENLQKQLKQKKWRTSDAFRGFVSIILKMIGVTNVDNMLDASVSAVEALMISTSSAQPVTEQATKSQPKLVTAEEALRRAAEIKKQGDELENSGAELLGVKDMTNRGADLIDAGRILMSAARTIKHMGETMEGAERRLSENITDERRATLTSVINGRREIIAEEEARVKKALDSVKETAKALPKTDVGVYEKTKGDFGFKSKTEPVTVASSFVASKPSFKDEFMGNVLGLTGRVQFIDQHAALSAAFKQGVAAEQISALEAEQGEFYLRFSQQTSQFAGQALLNGPVELRKAEGGGYIYASKPGANMVQVAEAVSKANVGNDTQTEAMFTAYLAGKRAEVVGWDKLNFDNPKLAEKEYNDVLNILKADKQAADAFKEAADIYQQYNNGQLDLLVQTGYMSEKLAANLKKTPYVPFYRTNRSGNVELVIDKENIVTLSNIKDEPQLKALVGDNTQIQPVFTSAVQNTFMITNMALRNQMMKDSSFLLKKMGIASTLSKGSGPGGPDTVRFKIKGEDHFVVIDTDMYGIPADLIIKGMEGIKTTLPAVFKLMGIPADVLRKFVTRNPAYAIKQAFRDPLTAWMTTGTDGVPVLNSFKELGKMMAGRSEEQAKLMASGAISSNVFSGDERDMSKFLKDLSVGKKGWDKTMAKLDAFAMQGDAATRAVVYKDSLNKGMSEMQALLRTLESMNFSRRGLSPSMQVLSTIIPFFNAQIQGLDVLYRAFTNQMPHSEQLKIRQKMLVRGLMLAAGTLAYAAMMQDDEAYKRAKPEERLANWFVYIPGVDEPMRVPIPFELGYLFKALPEAVFNMAADDERSSDITKGMGKLLALSNPFALPQAIKPLTEVILGKSFFSGDIESAREQQTMLPTERYRDSTTEFAKLLGSATGDAGLSPIKIDYLMRGYMGGLGIALVSLANPILNMEGKAEVAEPTKKISKMPFIGGMFQPIEGRGTQDAAYERMQEIQQMKGTFNKLIEEGKKDEAKEFAAENIDKISAASMSGSVQKQLGELAKYRRQIIASPRLTTEQKDTLLEKLDSAQVKIARNFITVTDRTTRQ